MKVARAFAAVLLTSAALSCAGCDIFSALLDVWEEQTDPEHQPARANVLFANGTSEDLDCYVNSAWEGTVGAFQQHLVRVDAGQVWLKATSRTRTWGPISVNLEKDGNFTWSILPNN